MTFEIKLNARVTSDWFIEPEGRAVFNGSDYQKRCVAAMAPREFDRVLFVASSNPRYTLWHTRREHGPEWFVHEALWVDERLAEPVLANVKAMFDRVSKNRTDPWVTIERKYVLPVLRFAAKKIGADGLRHLDFIQWVKDVETGKLHKRLIRNGVDPEIARKYRIS